jgi:hypothetical protein
VWGTDAYTCDSSICSAAVHAGAISLEKGGPVTVKLTEGRTAYQGSSRHGVVSREFGSWESSFEVAPAGRQTVAAVPTTTVATGATLPTAAPTGAESPTTTTATAPEGALAGTAPSVDSLTTTTASAPVDAIVFTNQVDDVSEGLFPNGSANIVPMPGSVSPRASNYLQGGNPGGPEFTSAVRNGTNLELTWSTVAGRQYAVDYKNDLNDPNWTPFVTNTAVGSSLSFTHTVLTPSQRYFRIREIP